MLFFRRLLTSCVLFAILSVALLITIGMIAGAHGGVNRPTGTDSRSYPVGYEVTRRYGAIVLLSELCSLARNVRRLDRWSTQRIGYRGRGVRLSVSEPFLIFVSSSPNLRPV